MAQKNWWGAVCHPSDELIHWFEVSDYGEGKIEFDKKVARLRAAWDLIHATPELAAAASIVRDQQFTLARYEQAENDAGESL